MDMFGILERLLIELIETWALGHEDKKRQRNQEIESFYLLHSILFLWHINKSILQRDLCYFASGRGLDLTSNEFEQKPFVSILFLIRLREFRECTATLFSSDQEEGSNMSAFFSSNDSTTSQGPGDLGRANRSLESCPSEMIGKSSARPPTYDVGICE
jgi:hypothetical protein